MRGKTNLNTTAQVPEAADDLQRIDEVEVQPKFEKRAVGVSYDVSVHTLRELDEHLIDRGYHLDNTLMSKLTRALVYYVEDTQLHNMAAPEKRLKRSSQEAYVKAWEHHPHGDHVDEHRLGEHARVRVVARAMIAGEQG